VALVFHGIRFADLRAIIYNASRGKRYGSPYPLILYTETW
jgi:hypothetical protein